MSNKPKESKRNKIKANKGWGEGESEINKIEVLNQWPDPKRQLLKTSMN